MARRGQTTALVVDAPIERLRRLRELQVALAAQEQALVPPMTAAEAFAKIGYEPNCVPRLKAIEAGCPVEDAPPPCGQCPQELFHTATEFDLGYGGSKGGGKSCAAVAEGIKQCAIHPGLQAFAFRRSYPELQLSLIKELRRLGYARPLGARWNASAKDLTFSNGSIFSLRYCKTLDDASLYQGASIQLLIIDERTLMPPEAITVLESCLRSGDENVPVIGIRSTFNPGGPGHADVRKRYIDSTARGLNVVVDPATQTTRRFIQAKAADNPRLNPEYEAWLNGLPEMLRRAFRDGDWDVFQGMAFQEWFHGRHVVRPFVVPQSWERISGVDWGYRNPWVCEWVAIDGDERVWVYREAWGTQMSEKTVARKILEDENGEVVDSRVGDPSMWNKISEAKPIGEVFNDEGVRMDKAKNDRLSGWQRIHTYLADGPACPIHRAMGWEKCPMMHVFECCAELIRTLPALSYSNKAGHEEDIEKGPDDHWADALRYALMGIGGWGDINDVYGTHVCSNCGFAFFRTEETGGSDRPCPHCRTRDPIGG